MSTGCRTASAFRTGKPCKMRCDYGMVSLVHSRVIWECVGREVTNPSSLRRARNCENTEERVLQELRPPVVNLMISKTP